MPASEAIKIMHGWYINCGVFGVVIWGQVLGMCYEGGIMREQVRAQGELPDGDSGPNTQAITVVFHKVLGRGMALGHLGLKPGKIDRKTALFKL